MAITFAQALAKYRPDQARDREGQWVDEGGGGDGAAGFRARLKPQTKLAGRKRLLDDVVWSIRSARMGDIASTAVGGGVPKFRAKQISDLQRFADELRHSIAQLEARSKPKAKEGLGTDVGNQLNKLFDRIARASQPRITSGPASLVTEQARLRVVTDVVRAEANRIIDSLAKAPPSEAYKAVKMINARSAKSRKAALLSLRQEVFRRIHDAHKGIVAYNTRPW